MTAYTGAVFTLSATGPIGDPLFPTGPTFIPGVTFTRAGYATGMSGFISDTISYDFSYVNRVYDTVAGKLVRWITRPSPDPTGASYPGPGIFGTNTSDYVVEGKF